MPLLRRYGLAIAVSAAALALFVSNAKENWIFTPDDTFITLRYAANLAHGAGPTWNVGDSPIDGYTSFLWVVLTALLHLIHTNVVTVAKGSGIAFTLATAVVMFVTVGTLARRSPAGLRATSGALSVLLFLAYTGTAVHDISGMETALFTLLLTILFFLAMSIVDASEKAEEPSARILQRSAVFSSDLQLPKIVARPRGDFFGSINWFRLCHARECWINLRSRLHVRAEILLPVTALLVGLCRPEGNLAAIIVITVCLFSLSPTPRRNLVRATLFAYVIPGAIYFAWRFHYYGHPLPLSFYVKTKNVGEGYPGRQEVFTFLRTTLVDKPYVGVPVGLGLLFNGRRLLGPVLAAAALSLFFIFPSHIMGYEKRFLFPLLALLFVSAGAGLSASVPSMEKKTEAAFAVVYAGLVISGFLLASDSFFIGKRDYGRGLLSGHIPLGMDLHNAAPDDMRRTLVIGDAGAVPYLSGWRTIDDVGLNDAVIAATNQRPISYIFRDNPDVVVLVSSNRTTFKAVIGFEAELYTECVLRGYSHAASYEFSLNAYYLYIMLRPMSLPPTIFRPAARMTQSS
ncbi:MAG: hypothetical protein NVS3B20_03760 [Polyangiales bacterium]